MSDIQPYNHSSSDLLLRDARRAGRSISRHQAGGQVRRSSIDVETDVVLDKLDSLTAVTGQGMGSVVRVALAQQQAELMAPATSGYLTLLANNHALGVADTAEDHRRNLRRI